MRRSDSTGRNPCQESYAGKSIDLDTKRWKLDILTRWSSKTTTVLYAKKVEQVLKPKAAVLG